MQSDDIESVRRRLAELMPDVIDELKAMVEIPSVAFPAFPSEPVHAMAERAVAAFGRYGVAAELREIPDGYPAVWAEIPGPEGSPTVLLYGHYDVQPAPREQGWDTDPFAAIERDGRIYGRGAADDKSGIAIHLATLGAFEGRPPVTVKLILEGEEETISHLEAYVDANPDVFQADVMIVADMGNLEVGEPVLTTDLRGDVKMEVAVETLEDPVHSGLFGGAAPDAMMALIKLLASIVDDDGNCRVPGLQSSDWDGVDYPEDQFRSNAGVLDGVDLVGTGSVASRLWSRPSISVLGIDSPSVDTASNVLHARARAILGMRIPPGQAPDAAARALSDFLLSQDLGGAKVTTKTVKLAPSFRQADDTPYVTAMGEALEAAYGTGAGFVGSGGSIPLLDSLRAASPQAEFLLIGAEDVAQARIHGPNESVDITEIENMALAQTLFLLNLGERGRS